MSWGVESTSEVDEWFETLSENDQDRILAARELLAEKGPSLGRPYVGSIETSKHSNMKELRIRTIRILFAFGPDRVALLLVGGDKSGQWRKWYREMVPRADLLMDRRIRSLAGKKRKE